MYPKYRLTRANGCQALPPSRYEGCHYRRPPRTISQPCDQLDKHRMCSPVLSEPQDNVDDHPFVSSPVPLFRLKPLPSTAKHGEPLSSPSPQINAPPRRHAPQCLPPPATASGSSETSRRHRHAPWIPLFPVSNLGRIESAQVNSGLLFE
jgi:hypothetical protein